MFNKRFLSRILVVLLGLMLGIGVLAQDDNTNLSHTENPVLNWLHAWSRRVDTALDEESSLPFVAQLGSLVERVDTQALNVFANQEHAAMLNKNRIAEMREAVSQWANVLQRWQNVESVPFARWLNRLTERLSKVFQPQPILSLSRLLDGSFLQQFNSFKLAK